MKRILSVLLALCLIVGIVPLSVGAADEEFVIENGVLIKYNGPGGDVVVPDGIVTIGKEAFQNTRGIKSVTLPDSVREIGNHAFYDCVMESITLPKTMPDGKFGVQAFASCNHLTNFTIPEGVVSIDGDCFLWCENLTKVTIPDSVTSLPRSCFSSCKSLTDVNIPETVTSIDYGAFYGCESLKSIALPKSLKTVNKNAFESCTSLTDIYYGGSPASWKNVSNNMQLNATVHYAIESDPCGDNLSWKQENGVLTISGTGPMYDFAESSYDGETPPWFIDPENKEKIQKVVIEPGVTNVGTSAFVSCDSLTEIVIGESVTDIRARAFAMCSGLERVTFGNNVKTIGDGAFYACHKLSGVTVPNSVTSIGEWGFSGCLSLKNFNIPASVTSLGEYAIPSTLENITVDPANPAYVVKDKVLFTKDMKEILTYLTTKTDTTYTVPAGVEVLHEGVMEGVPSLANVILNDGLKEIGPWVLASNQNLKTVTIPASVTKIDNQVFLYSNNITDVYYGGTEAQWMKFKESSVIGLPRSAVVHYNSTAAPTATPTPTPTATPTPTPTPAPTATPTPTPTATPEPTATPKPTTDPTPTNRPTNNPDPTPNPTSSPTTDPTPRPNFTDMPTNQDFVNAINWAVEKEVTTGTGGGKFSPDRSCTRAQIVTFLWRAVGKPDVQVNNAFSDMPANSDFQKAISWAASNDVTTGTGGGKFSPDKGCTRAQIVTFLWRAAGRPNVPVTSAFSDMPSNSDFQKAISWAVASGITKGTGNGKFSPNATCTRAQAVTFLYRAQKA